MKKVVCAGMRRSGSTWQYNAARLILAAEGQALGCFEDSWNLGGRANVVKTHRFDERFLFGSDTVVTIHRDLRDVAASAVRRRLIQPQPIAVVEFVTKAVREHRAWAKYAAIDQKYERVIADKPTAIAELAEALDAENIDAHSIDRLIENLPQSSPADPEILLHPDHITDGRAGVYAETLSPDCIAAIEIVFRSWLKTFGYLDK